MTTHREPELYAVIMAGGSGTRFWPASRRARPKQFLAVGGKEPLLARTFERLAGLVEPRNTLVVTASAHVDVVRATLPMLPRENVLGEPEGRNTAPCVAWAAWEIERRSPQAVQIVLPADHVIRPTTAFQHSVRAAARHAGESGALVTFGIRPTFAATGFGYIEAGGEVGARDGHSIRAVRRFVEKPDAERAREFLARGGFLWNAGIFLWSTAAIRAATRQYLPEAEAALARHAAGATLEEIWPEMPATPIDVAVLERSPDVHVLPVDYEWSDIGSWTSLPEVQTADAAGNVQSGGGVALLEDVKDCIVYGDPGRLTALIGVEGLVVVQAGDALLVCSRERAQDVKTIVERLQRDAPEFL